VKEIEVSVLPNALDGADLRNYECSQPIFLENRSGEVRYKHHLETTVSSESQSFVIHLIFLQLILQYLESGPLGSVVLFVCDEVVILGAFCIIP
jgi:hypothetical protein